MLENRPTVKLAAFALDGLVVRRDAQAILALPLEVVFRVCSDVIKGEAALVKGLNDEGRQHRMGSINQLSTLAN